jgi:hypothetical protein
VILNVDAAREIDRVSEAIFQQLDSLK